ncbi:hypothetical protein DL98DRAFT_24909 [Cadophora sp. DSE1049]|nr:hypothetical protein DL98DRAFT_24909 [Cadophora sp. DSE1049]
MHSASLHYHGHTEPRTEHFCLPLQNARLPRGLHFRLSAFTWLQDLLVEPVLQMKTSNQQFRWMVLLWPDNFAEARNTRRQGTGVTTHLYGFFHIRKQI